MAVRPIMLALLLSSLVLFSSQDDYTFNMRKPTKKRDMNVFHDICLRDRGGKLEDWMFQYASLHGLAKNKRMTAKLDSKIFEKMKKVFKFPLSLVDIVDVQKCANYEVAVDKRHSTFDRGFVQYIQGTDPVLLPNAHLHSWFYFFNCVRRLRQEYTLVDSLAEEATKILRAALQHARKNKHIARDKQATFIGIVVNRVKRGMDYTGKDALIPTAKFFRQAMNFFEMNFQDIVYIVHANDVAWAKNSLEGGPFVYVESQNDELVLAVMSKCKHMIISPGPFGFWAAFLANGETIYYKQSGEFEDTDHYSYHKLDYYLPYWRPLEQ